MPEETDTTPGAPVEPVNVVPPPADALIANMQEQALKAMQNAQKSVEEAMQQANKSIQDAMAAMTNTNNDSA